MTHRGELVLLANLGAEEGGRPRSPAAEAAVRRAATCWAALFAGRPALLERGGDRRTVDRPAPLAGLPDPAFPWLPTAGGVAWLSTPEAVGLLREVGCRAVRGPRPEVVRDVHDKAFAVRACEELGLQPPALEALVRVLEPEDVAPADAGDRVESVVRAWPAWAAADFTLKPRWGTSGRGRCRGRAGRLDDRGRATLRGLAGRGGAVLEPWLRRVEDLSVQLHVDGADRIGVLGTTRQLVTPGGAVLGNRGVLADTGVASGLPVDASLRQAAALVVRRAAERGFTGPCGVDGFTFAEPGGAVALRPVVELNARWTTGLVSAGIVELARRAGLLRVGEAWAVLYRGGPDVLPAGCRATVLGPDPAEAAVLLAAAFEGVLDAALQRSAKGRNP